MGLLEKIFQPQPKGSEQISTYFKTLTTYQPTFTSFSGGIYEAMITRAAINAIATHCSKLKPEVKGSGNETIRKFLAYKPNPWQNTQQFLYKLATILSVNNSAFIVPIYDEYFQKVIGLYPVVPTRCSILEYKGEPWLRYEFSTGNHAVIEAKRCGILTNFQYKDDFFGESNQALIPTLQMIHTQNEGIIEGVKNSASIRFMAKLASVLKPDDIEAERKRFAATNFATENNGGVMMFDSKFADVKQIDSKPYVVNADEMKVINESVYNYFGVSEKILRNEWDEQTYTAFYEGKIEPFAIQLGLALTNMLFKEREIAFGNEIMFSANRLQYASTEAKLQVSRQLLDRGILSRNDVREIWQLPPIDGGDEYIIRGEYMNADDHLGTDGENEEEENTDAET